jgi:hypothetical protein
MFAFHFNMHVGESCTHGKKIGVVLEKYLVVGFRIEYRTQINIGKMSAHFSIQRDTVMNIIA